MDGHWDWSEGGDDADTADLGDGGHELHADFGGEEHDFGDGHTHTGFGGDEHDFGGHFEGGHEAHGADSLEEPLGTEHATAEYDQSLHDEGHDPGHDGHEPGYDESAAGDPQHEDVQVHHGDTDTHADPHEAAFGADPDVHAGADDPAWDDNRFPEPLDLGEPPQPVDGFPWSDADVLGGPDHDLSAAHDPADAGPGGAEPAGLADYAGVDVPPGTDPWSLLLGSEDPAASTLAHFWAPS